MIINRALPRHPLSERGAAKRRGVSHCRTSNCRCVSHRQTNAIHFPSPLRGSGYVAAIMCRGSAALHPCLCSVAPSGLWICGCDCVQGFRCAPPLPVFRCPFGALGSALIMGLVSTVTAMPRRGIISITPDKRSAVWGSGVILYQRLGETPPHK